jgi:uncharacterized protein
MQHDTSAQIGLFRAAKKEDVMRILLSGSSGMIGSALARVLADDRHVISRLVRPQSKNSASSAVTDDAAGPDVLWDPVGGQFDADAAEGIDAVVHLAGASIGEGRWTAARKAILRASRVDATHHLIDSLAALTAKPRIFVCASAIGYFGNRGDEKLTEHSGPGDDFLAQLTRDWEREAQRAAEFGARVVSARFGIVLSTRGGALPRMMLPFKLFVGGKIGSGNQWMSWVTLADVVAVLRLAVSSENVRGPINTVSPQPARNSDFSKALAQALHRPAIFPAPEFALRTMLGEMADSLLLGSQRVVPEKLQSLGFTFNDPELKSALERIISERA